MEEEYKIEIALWIIQLKIAKLLNKKQENFEDFTNELKILKEEREKIYQMDNETIARIYDEYRNNKENIDEKK